MSIFYDAAKNNINGAINTLNQLTDNKKFEKTNTNISTIIINAIHSIGDYYERLDKDMITEDDDLWFKAYAYINNQIKHDEKFEIIHFPVYGSTYPKGYPMRYGSPGVSWNNFVDNGWKKSRGKHENYEEFLCDKDIQCTLKIILGIIEKVECEKQAIGID